MKKALLSTVALLALAFAVPANAAQLSIGLGASTGTVAGINGAGATGNAAAASTGQYNQTGFGAGVAAQSPAGTITTGVGAGVTNSTVTNAAVAGPGGGTAAAAGGALNNVLGVGAGVALP